MNKDIIYIDTEDDITAIIGKIKSSKEKVVALVPPKRTGVLQSAVNLRLLSRMAKNSDKLLVLITNNKALIALSASAKIPFAKNLQSKPEIAEIAALEIDDGEDIIDGAQLPIGELVKTADHKPVEDASTEDISSIDIDNEGPQYVSAVSSGSIKPQPIITPTKKGIKVPDFSSFRKKLFLGIAGGILFLIFLVWAIWFAPAARVIITTKTETAPVSMTLKLGGATATDITKNIVQTVTKQIKKDVSVDFTATGKKTIGDKATGVLTLSYKKDEFTQYVPAGSIFSVGDFDFATTANVVVPGAHIVNGAIVAGSVNVNVVAAAVGADYNLPPGAYASSISNVTAYGGQMSGGASHEATVVSDDDLQKATQALTDLPNNDVKNQLIKQFTNGEKIITDSFTADRITPVSVPALGAESADGKAKLTASTTFSITAIAKSELQAFLKNSLTKQISKEQRIYNDGIDKVVLSGYIKNDQETVVNVAANGKIGPNINEATVKNQVKGKRYGDVQALLESIKGVSNVDVKFSYFWVTTVPDDIKKIDVEFVLADA